VIKKSKEHPLTQLCIANGKEIPVKTTYRILLHQREHVYFIEKGNLSIFFLFSREKRKQDFYQQLADKSNTFLGDLIEGRLVFSATMKEGDFLFPFPLYQEQFPLVIATANENTLLRKVPLSWLREASESHPEGTTALIQVIRNWLISNSELLNIKDNRIVHTFIEDKQKLQFPKHVSFSLAQYPFEFYPHRLWKVQVLKGKVQIGYFSSTMTENKDGPLFLTPQMRLISASELEVEIDYQDHIKDPHLWDNIEFFNSLLSKTAIEKMHFIHAEERKNYKLLRYREEVILEKSISTLGSILHKAPPPKRDETESPLIKTIEILAASFGKDIHIPYETINVEKNHIVEYAKSACALGNLFFQEVNLPEKWLGYDSLLLLTFTNETPPKPLAALPSQTDYQLYNSEKERVKIKDEKAFLPKALAIYRSFPDKECLNWVDIVKYCFGLVVKDLGVVILTAILTVLAAFVYPAATQLVFDRVIQNHDYALLMQIAIGLVVVEIGRLLFQTAQEYAILRVEARLDHDMETAIWQRVLMMPANFYKHYMVGELLQRISSVRSMRKVLSGPIIRIAIRAFFSFLFLIVMFYYNALLSLVVLGILALYFIAISIFIPRSLKLNRETQENQAELDATIIQTILGISKIRTNGAENRIFYRWSKDNASSLFSGLKLGNIDTFNVSLNTIIPYLLQLAIVFVYLFWMKKTGMMGVAEFLAFYMAFTSFTTGLLSLSNTLFRILPIFPTWERSKIIFQEAAEFNERKIDPGPLRGDIRVESIYFRYPGASSYVLQNLSFHIKEGEFVAIIGQSGCGKSTLLRMLLGFEKPEQGAIYFDGKDLAKLNPNQVRRQLGAYLQHGSILDGTIRENILCGHYASDEDILQAVDKAGFLEDLRALPMGLNTVLASGGTTLSGGQKQRLMLARALLGTNKILLLDEATNALDNKTQAHVIRNLENLPITRIVIAHRLSTVKNANKILVLEEGRIIEEGTYQELLAKSPKLSELVRLQGLEVT
jgi:ATP-binding cassette subfamily C protein